MTKINRKLSAEKNELVLALNSGGSAVQDIIDKTTRLEGAKNDLRKQVDATNLRIKGEDDQINQIQQAGSKVTGDACRLRDEIKNLEATVEKKSAGKGRQKTEEDIQSMEDRCNHLNKVKGKLEQSLDECEDALEREKKSKNDVEKTKRKVVGDLKLTQEVVSDLERINSELAQGVQRKEKEVGSIAAKIEDEQTLGSKYSKQDKKSAETLNKNVQDMNASKLKRQFESSEANKKLNNMKLAIEHAGMDKNRFASQMEALSRAPSASGKARTLTKEKVRE